MQSNLPAELTQVLRHVDEWHYPHTDRQVTKSAGIVCSVDFGFLLPHDINAYAFSKYADVYVKEHQLGANKLPIRQPMLAKQTAQDMKESIEINRTILNYIYESAAVSPEKRQILANYVAQRGISSSDALRDEIFVQICSQSMISGNKRPTDSTVEAVWTLMATCLSCFPPSAGFAKYLLKYVSDNGPSGMDFVCQHKLLNCLQMQQQLSRPSGSQQQQQPPVKTVKPVRIVRSYPPCLLELKASTLRAGMALTGIFPDGERLTGQVESWVSAEQFAMQLLKNRNAVDQTSFSGWTVALKDEFDTYECAGHDFLLDLISEIEVPPYFPCGNAYFLTTTDVLRSNIASSARQKWPNQPHNADRLRLMMLEVDELSDLYMQAVPTSPIPPTPVSASPVPLLSPSTRVPPTTVPLGPPPSSSIKPEDVYASRDELMSQTSALNKRREPANADQLSKSSALNSRYTAVVTGEAAGPPSLPAGGASSGAQQPAGLPRPSLASDEMVGRTAWNQEPTGVQRSKSNAVRQQQQQQPYPGPSQPRNSYVQPQLSPPLAPVRSVPVAMRPQQQQQQPPMGRRRSNDMDMLIDDMFDINDDGYMEANALQRRIKGGGDERNAQPAPPMQFNIGGIGQPAYGLIPQPSLAVDPNAALHLQMLQQQLYQQAKQQQTADLQAALQAQQLQNQLLDANLQAEKLKRELNQLQRENAATTTTTTAVAAPSATVIPPPPPGFGTKKSPPPTQPKATAVGVKQAPVVIAPSNVTVAAAVTTKNGGKSVTFAAGSPPAASPSPPVVNGITNARPDSSTLNNLPSPPVLNAAEPVQAVSPPPAGSKTKLTVTIDASAHDIGSMRRPPKKIGQIRWPPVSPEEEVKPPRPSQEIGRIQIEELKEEEVPITPKQAPEEIQRRINDMIVAARQADAIGEAPPVKPKPPPKQPSKQATSILAETGNIDMKARQEQLQQQLKFPLLAKETTAEIPIVPAAAPSPPPAAAFTAPPPPPPPPAVTPTVAPQSPTVLSKPTRSVPEYEEATVPNNADPGIFDVHSLDYKRTALHAQVTDPFYTYDRVPWILEIRKEVFSPAEKFENPMVINMIFQQVVIDVLNEDCIRIGKSERQKLAALLDASGVNARNIRAAHNISVKRSVINAARDLPIYFCRLFTVFGGKRNPRLHMVGVSHTGIRLLTRLKDQFQDYIDVQHHIKFDDLTDITVPKQSTVLIRTVSGQTHVFYTPRACQLCNMVDIYLKEHREVSGRAGRVPLKVADSSLSVSVQNDYNNYYDFDDTS